MKRQKRDRLERAHQRGYQAGIAGRSKEMCPYQTLNQRSQWLGGWREAMADRVSLKRNLRIAEVSPFDTLSDYNQKADVSWNRPTFRSLAV